MATQPKRFLWLALATAMIAPGKARAKGSRSYASASPDGTTQRQARRRAERSLQNLGPVTSPCGRHVVEVRDGGVFVNGVRVFPAGAAVYLLEPPTFRGDGGAVAWLERAGRETRLVVVPELGQRTEPLPWSLPTVSTGDHVFWAGANRVVIGPEVLAPRAVASWTD
ncbi:MAG TPA: hypothetical protein VFH73_12245 [Polyangia bacterium]|nr:hypothetical protein [Polyangia bacterium]